MWKHIIETHFRLHTGVVERLPEVIRHLKCITGHEFKNVSSLLDRVLRHVERLSKDNAAFRDTIKMGREPVERYIPMNSRKGLTRTFAVSVIIALLK